MQAGRADGEQSQVRIDVDDALGLLDDDHGETLLAAGEALAVLDEDQAAEELMYVHQLVQEYFAARQLAREPDPELVRIEWRAATIRPSLDEVIEALDPADALPPLPRSGWEETTVLAASMADDPIGFLRGVMDTNLALAGRIAAQPDVLPLLPEDLLEELRRELVAISRNPKADLRARIACGHAIGDLGDPRFERKHGPHGAYLLPPLVAIPAGSYPIGEDEPIDWEHPTMGQGSSRIHCPRHEVDIAAFEIGRFAVTNAEWACFVESGGYRDERWWQTEDARRWRRGELPNVSMLENNRMWRRRFQKDGDLLQRMVDAATFSSKEVEERFRRWTDLDDAAFERELAERWKGEPRTEPRFWHDARLTRPALPVVGVCWYESQAYCTWLAEQSGLDVRLPTEVEWEAAARGLEGRRYPWGDRWDGMHANVIQTWMKRTSPVGVFPAGDSPLGITDLAGNVREWTSSLISEVPGSDEELRIGAYPYVGTDGREVAEASSTVRRIVRGGGWYYVLPNVLAAYRDNNYPDQQSSPNGFRIVVAPLSPNTPASPSRTSSCV
jgi:formylglycine-generating enzyme required for sulfatase activity